jgi:hypothetical protein
VQLWEEDELSVEEVAELNTIHLTEQEIEECEAGGDEPEQVRSLQRGV